MLSFDAICSAMMCSIYQMIHICNAGEDEIISLLTGDMNSTNLLRSQCVAS